MSVESTEELFSIKLKRCLNSSNLRPEFPVCPLTHAIQSPPWLMYQGCSEVSQAPWLYCYKVCRKKPTFICYCCKHFIATSEWGEEQSCWSPPFPKGFLYTLQTWFIPPLSAHVLRHLLGSGSVSRPCWWKLGIILKATDQLPSASQLLLPFLHQCKCCNNKQKNHQIIIAFLIQSMADWLCFPQEQGCRKALWRSSCPWRFPF